MEKARQAVADFTSRRGHTTEVDELVHPGITNEIIKPHRHEETTQAINREVHQHHHHTTIQPISHQETLPEKHTHNLMPVHKQEFQHGDPQEHESRLSAMKAHFRDSSTVHETTHSTSAAPQVTGEHVHHHVHEIVQPVIHKETIQPEVVHTTHPIHEVHHHHATHHGMSALPMKTLDEFKTAGGILTGQKSSTHETYDGEPRPYNKELETTLEKLGLGHHGSGTNSSTGPTASRTGGHQYNDSGVAGVGSGSPTTSSAGAYNNNRVSPTASRTGPTTTTTTNTTTNTSTNRSPNSPIGQQSGKDSSHNSPSSGISGTGNRASNEYGGTAGRSSMESETRKKPSLLSRLNPLKDSDGDGQKGFMK